ncbi:MAG: cyclic nucleotide-binding domain-containing protein [Rhodospirillales bacterium]|jgi:CRP/FNR family transcriptional regulator, cyclic AMP receptor protein|nr:cyclic nucleotide-binding domain-containing protein [Rhodospirillales bacterium]
MAQKNNYQTGTMIFREGEKGNCAFILNSGAVELSKMGPNNKKIVIEIIRDGIFAVLPLVDNQPRQYTAITLEQTQCTVITRKMFEERLSATDPAVRSVVRFLTRSLRDATNHLVKGDLQDFDLKEVKW